MIPPHTPHGFAIEGRSRPLCLVLDYQLERSTRLRATHRRLAPDRLNELHALLARVPAKGRLTLSDYPGILAVVARLLESPAASPNRNSNNHGSHGSYVLSADGAVAWQITPNVGPKGDNIWTLGNPQSPRILYSGTEVADSPDDVFLAP